jgi:hypothetical protein
MMNIARFLERRNREPETDYPRLKQGVDWDPDRPIAIVLEDGTEHPLT